MAALDVKMILSLVDRASGPARSAFNRILGGNREVAGTATHAAGAMAMLSRSVAGLAAGAGAYVGLSRAVGGAMDFEAAMADVAKKVNATEHELKGFEAAIKQIARTTPLAQTEVAALVAQAGQFGIANQDILRFSQLGAKAAVAFDMQAQEAANSLSQIKNALDLNMDGLEQYADAINAVADSAGTSESMLINFVLRTAGSAKAAGMASLDLLAFGASMNEVGLSSERSATAINAMLAKFSALSTKKKSVAILDKFAGKGYSAKLQKKFFDTPREAMVDFFKLAQKMDKPGRAGLFMDFLGLETQDEATILAGSIDKIVDRIEKLGDTSSFAGSVDKTFKIFANTTEAQLKQFRQNVDMSLSAMGASLLPAINGSLQYLNEFFADDNRETIFDRLSAGANGFLKGLGFEGGMSEMLESLGQELVEFRDLLFGKDMGGQTGETIARHFEEWRRFGEDLKPVVMTLRELSTAMAELTPDGTGEVMATMGGGLLAASLGIGAFGLAAKIALAPVRAILGVFRGLARVVGVLTGYKLAKWLYDVGKAAGDSGIKDNLPDVPDGKDKPKPKPKPKGGGMLAWLARNGWKGAKWGAKNLLGPAGTAYTGYEIFDWINGQIPDQAPPPSVYAQQALDNANGARQFGIGGNTTETLPGKTKDDLGMGVKPVTIQGPVQTTPSGVQKVEVTNPPPAPVINVTVHATTNADPNQIAAQTGQKVAAAYREAMGDGGFA